MSPMVRDKTNKASNFKDDEDVVTHSYRAGNQSPDRLTMDQVMPWSKNQTVESTSRSPEKITKVIHQSK